MGLAGTVAVAAVMAVGLVGVVLPFVPGTALIWGAGLVYGLVDGFGTTGRVSFGLMTVLAVAGAVAEYALPHRAGVTGGAPRSTLRFAVVLGLVGFFVIPVLGLPIGAVGGVFLAEYRRLGQVQAAWLTTRRVITGFGQGMLAEFTAALAMIATWAIWIVAG